MLEMLSEHQDKNLDLLLLPSFTPSSKEEMRFSQPLEGGKKDYSWASPVMGSPDLFQLLKIALMIHMQGDLRWFMENGIKIRGFSRNSWSLLIEQCGSERFPRGKVPFHAANLSSYRNDLLKETFSVKEPFACLWISRRQQWKINQTL